MVSVVMSVYNGAEKLAPSIESVLNQEKVRLEFVIVNDGSGSETTEILESYAKTDNRIRLLHRENRGLTRSLMEGCAATNFNYLARQDAGDLYLAKKLWKQLEVLEENPNVKMVTCGTRFVGPQRENLFEVSQTTVDARKGLACLNSSGIRGPSHHCSVVFRKCDYEKVGGYRSQFRVAQDLDLWLRLAELGEVVSIPEVLFEAEFAPNTISGTSRKQQIEFSKLLIECAIRRQQGKDENVTLMKAQNLEPNSSQSSRQRLSEANYYIARLLQRNRDPRCLGYFKESISANRFNWKAWLASLPARVAAPMWKVPDEILT